MRLKRLLMSLIALLMVMTASAQDIITRVNGSAIRAKVEEVSATVVKYRAADNLQGPLYSIPVSEVATITYRNGKLDRFNPLTQAAIDSIAASQNAASTQPQQQFSDSYLLSLDQRNNISGDPIKLRKNAKKLRYVGWIGGGTLLVGGALVFILQSQEPDGLGGDGGVAVGVGSFLVASGLATGITCNIIANNKIKKANMLDSYNASVIETDVLKLKGSTLSLGMNVMGERMTRSYSFGPSVSINF